MSTKRFLPAILLLLGLASPNTGFGHGGVAFEDDLCVISINFLQAHFTVFQPQASDSEEFCEDLPEATDSVFVMEYLHRLLDEMYIDFRIIRDVNNLGRFARWEDVQAMGDLEEVTVYYQPPAIEPGGYYRASHDFAEDGTYIGIVTATHPTEARDYNAVFYFRVGGPDLGTIPLFIALIILLQLGYWVSNGGYKRWQAKRQFRMRA
ncbi:MAG: hypothetical protein RL120_10850 [Gammaproteobacteria bacterium]